jgi:hypothetical protein
MADYYPLIARAVAGLDKNTGDARRTIYERARTALVAQLRSVEPELDESDITRERLALEESIRKVEAEAARKMRSEPARIEPAPKVRAPDAKRWEAASRWDEPPPGPVEEPPPPVRKAIPPWPEPAPLRPLAAPPTGEPPFAGMLAGHRTDSVFDTPTEPAAPEPEPRNPVRPEPGGDGRSLPDGGLRDFRDVVSEAKGLGDASARAVKSARESFDAVADPVAGFDHPVDRMLGAPADVLTPEMLEPSFTADEPRPALGRTRAEPERDFEPAAPRRPPRVRSYRGLMRAAASLLVVASLTSLVAWQWPAITLLYRWASTPAVVEAPKEPTPTTRPKIGDRLDPNAPSQQAQPGAATNPAIPAGAAVAQRVVLYEEDPAEPAGRRFVGSAIWRTEAISPGPGRSPELAIRADIEIPERKLAMTWSLRRNTDAGLPASHTVEIMFKLPPDFPAGTISNVPGILMKQTEQTRGVPLAGLAVKVTNGFFLIGLSATDTDRDRNVQLLKERSWLDIPVVYSNNRRAILALEKGTPGERVFADAFRAWGQ